VLALLIVISAIAGTLLTRRRAANPVNAKATEQIPVEDNAYALYKAARESLDHWDRPGAVDRAIKLLNRAVELNPNSAASYAALTEAYYHKNQANPDPQWTKLGADSATQAVKLDGYLAAAHLASGIAAMQASKLDDAEKEFRRAADLDPKSSEPHRWLGTLFDKGQHFDKAGRELEKAVQLEPGDWNTYMAMGLNSYLQSDFKTAALNWDQALKLEPDNVLLLRNLGAVYHMLERDDDAAAALQAALAIQPDADTYNNLGTLRFYQGRYADSVAAFEKATALEANYSEVWGNLGDAYRWTPGDSEKAKQAYGEALRLIKDEIDKSPDDVDLRAMRAVYLAKSGDKQAAMEALQPVEQAAKKPASALFHAGVVYEICGQRDKALKALSTAVKEGESLADIKAEPELVSLRADPRYHLEILAKAAEGSASSH
jgi:serine/threonine-protein kinase